MTSLGVAGCRRRATEGLARRALVVLVFLVLLAGARARAAVGSPRLEIVVVGPPATTDLLAATVAPLLPATAPVDWRSFTSEAAVPGTLAPRSGPRIWIDGHSSGKVQIVAFRGDAVPRVRTIEAPELTPVVAETVAQITRETAVALLTEAVASAPPDDSAKGAVTRAPTDGPPTVAASAPPAQPRNLLFVGSLIARDAYGLGAEAAYGGAISAAYLFGRAGAGSTVQPFLCLSLGTFGDSGFGVTALEVVETAGISWQASSLVDLSVGVGGGVEDLPNTRWSLVARGAASVGFRLGGSLEQIFTATLDVRQAARVDGPWPPPNRVAPGALIGIGWRPR